ncbi:hypothetical protein OG241_22985 [Streptomyces sp. NBC_01390]|uniref:hypothetical protein n=1 Tax=Streptomyces sp. NBC_01390 TaxID=2903850 RepID=UPI0032551D97
MIVISHSSENRSILASCGLDLYEDEVIKDVPETLAVVQIVSSTHVRPVVSISKGLPNAIEELSRRWHQEAKGNRLASEQGKFLLMPAGEGATSRGWFCVKDSCGEDLPARLLKANGSVEFIGMSLDGERVCAVSEEDDEYWIVVENLD